MYIVLFRFCPSQIFRIYGDSKHFRKRQSSVSVLLPLAAYPRRFNRRHCDTPFNLAPILRSDVQTDKANLVVILRSVTKKLVGDVIGTDLSFDGVEREFAEFGELQ